MNREDFESMLKENVFVAVYPKDKTEASAQKIADMLDAAVAIASFEDENGDLAWGVLIDKRLEKSGFKEA